ncbi:hypothetical protein [Roseobacter sp.]|uniref:hypothetical protein n=1 Tax=Roseobacter sp. TaxID=1907202 RepID=UPI00385B26A2
MEMMAQFAQGSDMIADILLIAGALGAGFYCLVLSRRLRRFNDLEKGVGGAVAVLSAQVDDMTKTLDKAHRAAVSSTGSLDQLTERAEDAAKRLELLVASMHDLPEPPAPKPNKAQEPVSEETLFKSHRDRAEAEV